MVGQGSQEKFFTMSSQLPAMKAYRVMVAGTGGNDLSAPVAGQHTHGTLEMFVGYSAASPNHIGADPDERGHFGGEILGRLTIDDFRSFQFSLTGIRASHDRKVSLFTDQTDHEDHIINGHTATATDHVRAGSRELRGHLLAGLAHDGLGPVRPAAEHHGNSYFQFGSLLRRLDG